MASKVIIKLSFHQGCIHCDLCTQSLFYSIGKNFEVHFVTSRVGVEGWRGPAIILCLHLFQVGHLKLHRAYWCANFVLSEIVS